MIIKIKKTNYNIDAFQEKTTAIENILSAYGEGKHIIIAENDFFEMVKSNKDIFGENTRRFADAAGRQQFEFHPLISKVCFYVEVDFEKYDKENTIESNHNTDKLILSYNEFTDSAMIQKMTILCEDISDVHFYSKFASYYSEQNNLSIINIEFKPENGGGANTKKNYDTIRDEGKMCLCIIDNDKKHPNGPMGSTSKAFGSTQYNDKCKVFIIEAHEAESLIPIHTIQELLSLEQHTHEAIDSIDLLKLLTPQQPDAKLYFDHKEGLSLKKALELDQTYGDYWTPILRKTNYFKNNSCLINKKCNSECCHYRIVGYGKNLLEKSINQFKTKKMSSIARNTENSLLIQWLSIGKIFFSWCCAPPKKTRI